MNQKYQITAGHLYVAKIKLPTGIATEKHKNLRRIRLKIARSSVILGSQVFFLVVLDAVLCCRQAVSKLLTPWG